MPSNRDGRYSGMGGCEMKFLKKSRPTMKVNLSLHLHLLANVKVFCVKRRDRRQMRDIKKDKM